MLKGSGDFSPKDPEECPETCPFRPKSGNPEDCERASGECIYEIDKDTLGDTKYHGQF